MRKSWLQMVAALAVFGGACGEIASLGGSGEIAPANAIADIAETGSDASCVGLECNRVTCEDGKTTSISGTTYAPNGELSLYNVAAFIPNAPLPAIDPGVSCNLCTASLGAYVSFGRSKADGTFRLDDVPVGLNIPFVVQTGKWRRVVTIPEIKPCVDNKLPKSLTRLPSSQKEGDLPRIALTTGGCDSIGCALPKLGIDPSEFGDESDIATKSVIIFDGEGGSGGSTPAANLWGNPKMLDRFALSIFSCECTEALSGKPASAFQNVRDYLDKGGRVYATDFMYTWLSKGPSPMPKTMKGFVGGAPYAGDGTYKVDQSFEKGKAMAGWLKANGASSTLGELELQNVFANFVYADPAYAQKWISNASGQDRVISYTMPFENAPGNRCGKGYFLDVHVSNDGYPTGCTSSLSPQEKALVFLLFDLISCGQDDTKPTPLPENPMADGGPSPF